MKISIIGAGYVGLVTGSCLADLGNDVICVDNSEEKIAMLQNGQVPIYEPGLEEMIKRNIRDGRLSFLTSIQKAVEDSLFIFIAVGTPTGEDGSTDLKYVLEVAKNIGHCIDEYKIIVIKSTVPVGTTDRVRGLIKEILDERNKEIEFDVVSNPEFLKEGSAIDDFMKPDRIVIGVDNVRTAQIMKELYSAFIKNHHRVMIMDIHSSEMTKYAANAMLATKISFINEIANLCERYGADIDNVRIGIGADERIGCYFLNPGIGYGGSCLPKDVKAIIKMGENADLDMKLITAVEAVNEKQKSILIDKILSYFDGDIKGKTFAVWGLAFKPKTDDVREAPAITIIQRLVDKGAIIQAYDPEANNSTKAVLKNNENISYFDNNYSALIGVEALVLLTEWSAFRNPDFAKMKSLMNRYLIFDGRNQYVKSEIKKLGFEYFSIGR
ncbi:MAG: UDP-glucose/GDP-mannose dehydrogenase family protein [Clostridia bacterium]|nr:UDP-glucose/GDP-mannose dehydrogenase family protein [Clostridia bacterium]